MNAAGARGARTGVTVAAALLCAAAWMAPGGTPPAAPAAVRSAWARPLPRVGADILPRTHTCARSRRRATATTAAGCAAWELTGPVNVVVVRPGGGAALDRPPAPWRSAAGGWLVARGDTAAGWAGCTAAVHDSREQIELRIDPVTRRHLKLLHARCGGDGVVFGEAHTDLWTPRCGDHAVDWDRARDALVAALARLPAFVRVRYLPSPDAPPAFPGGCGGLIPSDGRVAYVLLAP
ncbi:MAG TPA: hypothetical protein VH134_15140 [Candidatus Dormibacteraeota bacterium]|jgi:hypothetical protein|nr:hypothetical protein [Candidatus Dormibacteraeota bacterium]